MPHPRKAASPSRAKLTAGSIEAKLRQLESKDIKKGKLTGSKRKLALNRAVLLIGTLGYGAAAKEVEAGKHTAAEKLTFVANNTKEPRRQQIARLGAVAAREAGI